MKAEETQTKIYHPPEYLYMIRPYLRDMINNHKAPLEGSLDNDLHGGWKIQLTMQINFVSPLDPEEICTMDSKSKNRETFFSKISRNIRRKNEG